MSWIVCSAKGRAMDLRKQRTLKLLRESLFDLMKRMPYDKITVVDICAGAMVRRATFYHHFGCKDDLLRHMVSEQRSAIDAAVDPDGSLPLADYCRDMTAALFRFLKEEEGILAANRLSTSFNATLSLIFAEVGARFAEKLRARSNGTLSEGENEWLGVFYATGLMGAMVSFLQDPKGSSEDEFLDFHYRSADRLFASDPCPRAS